MKYLWSTYVQLMWLEVLQLFTFFRLELWRGLTPPYEWMALRWLFVATSAPVLDCAFVSIGEYVFRKPDVSCFKEIYTQLRYSNPKCREDESKAKVPWKQKSDEPNHGRVMGEGWRVKGGGKAKLSKLPSQASKRRNKATFWSCWAEDHQGIGIHLTTSHDPIIPMIPMILPLHESRDVDVKCNSTLQYSFGLCTAQVFVAHHKTVTWKTLKNYESICCQVTGTWQSKVQDSNRTPMHSTCNVCSLNRL